MSTRDKILSSVLGLLILAAISAIAYIITSPPPGEGFTEFYVRGVEGKAEGYPKELVVGEEVKVLLGIVNHEYQVMSYRVVMRIDGMKNEEIGPVVLEHEEEWEQEVSFIPGKMGENQGVEFLLFKEGEDEPYTTLGPFPSGVKGKE